MVLKGIRILSGPCLRRRSARLILPLKQSPDCVVEVRD